MSRVRTFRFLFVALLLLAFITPYAMASVPQVDNSIRIYDYADMLTDSEIKDLSDMAAAQSEAWQMDFAAVFTNDSAGLSPREYAESFYTENNFGYGAGYDGILLYVNMTDRDIYVATCGAAKNYISDSYAMVLYESAAENMTSGAESPAYLTVSEFLREAGERIAYIKSLPSDDKDYVTPDLDEPQYVGDSKTTTGDLFVIAIILGFGVSLITVLIMLFLHGRALSKPPSATEYMVDGSLRVLHSTDTFLHTRTTRVAKNTGSGVRGGGSRGGSGGRSFGGGGGKF